MTRSIQAALWSAVVFPGAGHIFLKRYSRGLVFIAAALGSLLVIAAITVQQALAIIDKLEIEDGPIDVEHISQMVTQGLGTSGGSLGTIAIWVLVACWVVGIVDAYRLGLEKSP
jgi:hypothetical protein